MKITTSYKITKIQKVGTFLKQPQLAACFFEPPLAEVLIGLVSAYDMIGKYNND